MSDSPDSRWTARHRWGSGRRRRTRLASTLALLGLLALVWWFDRRPGTDTPRTTSDRVLASSAEDILAQAFRDRRSGFMVEGTGAIVRFLPDDDEGDRHQRFVLRLDSGQTLLVSHNIDLAPRLDGARPGDRLLFRGQYEWNDHGGVIHWTHHDPQGRRPGGWLRHRDRTLR